MGLWTKQQLRAFIKDNKLVMAQDAQNTLKDWQGEFEPIVVKKHQSNRH